ncbi:MAG: class I tRNA ligase family protein, partial [Polyangiales bacterium]
VRTTRDGDFSRERFVAAYNAELANGLGNLVQRVLGLTARANAGRVPDADLTVSDLTAITRALPAKVSAAVQTFALDDGLAHIFEVVDAANRFIDRTAPWAAIRAGDLASARQVLRAVLDTLAVLATELTPFLPRTAARLGEALGCHQGGLRDGWQLPDTLHLFPRVER